MATIDLDEEVQESVEVSDEMWSTDEISTDYDVWAEHSPDISISVEGDIITNCSNFHDFLENKDVEVNGEDDTVVEEFMCEGLEEEIAIDNGEEAKTYTFAAITVIERGDMPITVPNGQTTTQILLKDVLYVPKMGVTLISIGKIDTAGYVALFHKNQLQIFYVMKGRRVLAQIPIKNGLYCVEHENEVDIAAVVVPEVVTVEKLQ